MIHILGTFGVPEAQSIVPDKTSNVTYMPEASETLKFHLNNHIFLKFCILSTSKTQMNKLTKLMKTSNHPEKRQLPSRL